MAAAAAAAAAWIVHKVSLFFPPFHVRGAEALICQAHSHSPTPPPLPKKPPIETGTPDMVKKLEQDLEAVTTAAPPPTPIAAAAAATDAAAAATAAATAAALPASLHPSPPRHGAKRARFLLDSPLAGVTAGDLHVAAQPPRTACATSHAGADSVEPQDDWAAQLERLEGAF